MNGWLLLRLLGIVLGIITMLGFATDYLHVFFVTPIESGLKVLQETAGLIVAAPFWEMVLDWLRQHFGWVPKPEPHWKPIYTLSALLMLSAAQRNSSQIMIPNAIVCSLVPAVFAGTVPVFSPFAYCWPLAGILVFFASEHLLLGGLTGWRARVYAALYAAYFAAFLAFAYFVDSIGVSMYSLEELAKVVGSMGLFFLVHGLFKAKGDFSQRLQSPEAAFGLNITATLGGALFFGWLFAA